MDMNRPVLDRGIVANGFHPLIVHLDDDAARALGSVMIGVWLASRFYDEAVWPTLLRSRPKRLTECPPQHKAKRCSFVSMPGKFHSRSMERIDDREPTHFDCLDTLPLRHWSEGARLHFSFTCSSILAPTLTASNPVESGPRRVGCLLSYSFSARTILFMNGRLTRRNFSTIFAALGSISATAREKRTKVPRLTSHWMEIASVPGAAVAVIEKGSVRATEAFGQRLAGSVARIDQDTIFEAASLSKPVFATAVLSLVDERLLDLDHPLYDLIPLTDDPRAKLITARHLLSHTSGLQDWRTPRRDKFEFRFKPGQEFSYSGEGYFYLQRVVEKITGKPFAQFMHEKVLGPLGMARSSYVWREDDNSAAPHDSRGRAIEQYKATAGKQIIEIAAEWKKAPEAWTYEDVVRAMPRLRLPVLPDFMQPNAAGSLFTTAADYSQFVLHSLSIEAMHRPQIKINTDLYWGLGCGLELTGNDSWFWHWGDNAGFQNFFIVAPKTQSGLLVFTNGDGGAKLYQRIVRNAINRDYSAFLWI